MEGEWCSTSGVRRGVSSTVSLSHPPYAAFGAAQTHLLVPPTIFTCSLRYYLKPLVPYTPLSCAHPTPGPTPTACPVPYPTPPPPASRPPLTHTPTNPQGRLPCDSELLLHRGRALLLLDPHEPRLRLRQLLTSFPRAALAHDPHLLVTRARTFAHLLPEYDTTLVLTTVLPHLERDPYITAMNYRELDELFGAAFGGARVPPSVFAHLLRAPGASVVRLDTAALLSRLRVGAVCRTGCRALPPLQYCQYTNATCPMRPVYKHYGTARTSR